MLKVDLGLLQRRGRLVIDDRIGVDDPVWRDTGVRPARPLHVRATAEKVAGAGDVLVRGRVAGEVRTECRRCLREVGLTIDEALVLLYRPGVSASTAEAAEMYPIGERDREVDLAPAVREHVMLALSQYPVCDQTCKGLCPTCGTNLNESTCTCERAAVDSRWSALRRSPE